MVTSTFCFKNLSDVCVRKSLYCLCTVYIIIISKYLTTSEICSCVIVYYESEFTFNPKISLSLTRVIDKPILRNSYYWKTLIKVNILLESQLNYVKILIYVVTILLWNIQLRYLIRNTYLQNYILSILYFSVSIIKL